MKKSAQELIKLAERAIAKYKFVEKHFPNVIIRGHSDGFINYKNPEFVSSSVNKNYTHLEFESSYNLYVLPYHELEFDYNDKTEIIKVHSMPKRNVLARLTYRKLNIIDIMNQPSTQISTNGLVIPPPAYKNLERVITFSRFKMNMKSHNFNEKMLKECQIEITKFIQKNADLKLDTKHLDPRLKKMLAFN